MAGALAPLTWKLDRRRLLWFGGGLTTALALGALGTGYALFRSRSPAAGRRVLTDDEGAFFRAVAEALFPPDPGLELDVTTFDVATGIDGWLSVFAPGQVRVVRALVAFVDGWPRFAWYGGAFTTLPLDARISVLRAFDESALEPRRAIVMLLRILVATVLFEDPRAKAAAGYADGCEGIR